MLNMDDIIMCMDRQVGAVLIGLDLEMYNSIHCTFIDMYYYICF